MSNMPGDKFVSKGIEYVLGYGPKGNLRPFTVGPVVAGLAAVPVWGWIALAVVGVVTAGAVIYNECEG